MTAEETPEIGEKTVLVRIVEWGAWMPRYPDAALSQIKLAEGVTGFKALDNERLVNLDVMNTSQVKRFDMQDPDDQVRSVEHVYYAFQAVLASNSDGEIPEGPSADRVNVSSLVMPTHHERVNHKGQR